MSKTVTPIKTEASCAMHEPPCPTCIAVALRNERARLLRALDIIKDKSRTNREHDLLIDVQREILQYKRTKE